jgi:hypothetical protein
LLLYGLPITLVGQKPFVVQVISNPLAREVKISIQGEPFTQFIYPDSLEKPVLYPIYAPDQQIVTRGFPIQIRDQEPTDHPHHIGLWFNYENVNGIDFWNNSYAITPDKKHAYGWIKVDSILKISSGSRGILTYSARWVDQKNNILLKEITSFIFFAVGDERIIDRITVLTAERDVSFADAKDGLLGLRVAHQLELPSFQPRQFSDNKGNITTVAANDNRDVTGNYLTSEGKQGDSAWGTRGVWCLLYGKLKNDSISIAIIDHPQNPGYPTYWHARGYGLFAANPLGQKIFSNGKYELGFALPKGQSVTFRYRVVIKSGKQRIDNSEIDRLSREFGLTP